MKVADNNQRSRKDFNRDAVIEKLRPSIRNLLGRFESKTGLAVRFGQLEGDCKVLAQYGFSAPDKPVVYLRDEWRDAEVAHELMHGLLELCEGYSVLGWRKGIQVTEGLEWAVRLIRSHVDDAVVHERLYRSGLELDGEVITGVFFDDVCTEVPRRLRRRFSREFDGMTHLDKYGYGELRRSAFLVNAELYVNKVRRRIEQEAR